MAKILIADDSPAMVAAFARAPAPSGHTVIEAHDGEEAGEKIAQERPELVTLDVVMPKVNGFEVCLELRADPRLADTRVTLITSMARPSDEHWGIEQGANAYLIEPVAPAALIDTVRAYL